MTLVTIQNKAPMEMDRGREKAEQRRGLGKQGPVSFCLV